MRGHVEFWRVCAPVKREIRHLDTRVRHDFDRILNELINELKRQQFKLRMISKRYVAKTRFQADSYWCAEEKVKPCQVNFVCTVTLAFGGGFEITCDVDYFLKFPLLAQKFRTEAKQYMNLAPNLQSFVKAELDRVWEMIEEQLLRKIIERSPAGWGRHSLPQALVDTPRICHLGTIVFSHLSSSEDLLKLAGMRREIIDFVNQIKDQIADTGDSLIQQYLPPPVLDATERAALSALLRHQEGLLEYQLRRYLLLKHNKQDVDASLRRLQLWRYIECVGLPNTWKKKLETLGIRRYLRFCRKGKTIPREFEPGEAIRIGLEPVTIERIKKILETPEHLVERAIRGLCRKRILQKIKTIDHRGEPIAALRIKRWPKNLSPLELQILNLIANHFREQGKILDECRKLYGKEE